MENSLLAYLAPSMQLEDRLDKLRDYVKRSLWNLGYGSNQHLPSLKGDIYFERRAKDKYPFLLKIMDFYQRVLDAWEKRYFIIEILEKGEHYAFWHNDMSTRTFCSYEKMALTKIKEGLFNEETPF